MILLEGFFRFFLNVRHESGVLEVAVPALLCYAAAVVITAVTGLQEGDKRQVKTRK